MSRIQMRIRGLITLPDADPTGSGSTPLDLECTGIHATLGKGYQSQVRHRPVPKEQRNGIPWRREVAWPYTNENRLQKRPNRRVSRHTLGRSVVGRAPYRSALFDRSCRLRCPASWRILVYCLSWALCCTAHIIKPPRPPSTFCFTGLSDLC